MKKAIMNLMVCTILCIIAVTSAKAQNFTMIGVATPVATVTSSDANDTICVGDPVNFSATTTQLGWNYQFNVNGGAVEQGPGIGTIYVPAAFPAGSQQVILTVDNGTCSATDTVNFTTLALPVPVMTVTDNSVCVGTSVVFNTTNGTNYNYRVDGISQQNSTSPNFTTSSLTNGQVVTCTVTNAGGCVATTAPITMTIYASPVATISTPDNSVCANSSVIFTASGGVNNNFKVGGISYQNGAAATYTTATLTDGQTVSVDVTDGNGCMATASTVMTIFPIPHATTVSGNAVGVCVGSLTNVTINGLIGTAPFSLEAWNTTGGVASSLHYTIPGTTSTTNTVVAVPVPAAGIQNMFLRVTDANGCSNH